MITLQEIIRSIVVLPTEDRDHLFEFLCQQRIQERRAEIAAHARELMQAVDAGTAKMGSVDDLIADLLGDDDESCLE